MVAIAIAAGAAWFALYIGCAVATTDRQLRRGLRRFRHRRGMGKRVGGHRTWATRRW